MNTFAFRLIGKTPILFHADDVEQSDILSAWRKDPDNKGKSVAGDDRSPPWTYRTYFYTDGEHVCMPFQNIMVALRTAGAKINMKGQTTFKAASQSGLLILDEDCRFEGPSGQVKVADLDKFFDADFSTHAQKVQDLGFRLHVKRATLPSSKSKHVRVRPRFDDWTVSGRIQIVDDTITPDILQQMFEIAGRVAGLGDWRPSSPTKPGPYGQFDAELRKAK